MLKRRACRAEVIREEGTSPPSSMLGYAVVALAALVALVVYLRTLAPTITYAHSGTDSGDLVTAAINLGVGHPTGYPLYTLLAHGLTLLPWFEPAHAVALLSAVAAAVAVGGVCWLSQQLPAEGGSQAVRLAGALCAALLFAFGELLWSQATIAEVYSLHTLLVVALLVAGRACSPRCRPYVLAFLLGLGLANHVTIVFLLPAAWPYLGAARRWLTPRRAAGLALCLLPGLLSYIYIPLRAGAYPVPNWGLATTPGGLFWLVSGAAYRRYVAWAGPMLLVQRLSAWAGIWVRDLTVPGLALALLGLWRGLESERRFHLFGLSYVLLLSAYAMGYVTQDSYLYLLPGAAVVSLWVARGVPVVAEILRGCVAKSSVRRVAGAVALVAVVALPFVSMPVRYPSMDLSQDWTAYTYAEGVLRIAKPGALVISNGDAQTFPLWYLRYGLGRRTDVTVVDRSLLAFEWYRRDVAARDPSLRMLLQAGSGEEASALIVSSLGAERPIQLAYPDHALLQAAHWTDDGPLMTLDRE